MSTYDDVLGAPDRKTRQEALDRYGLELLGGRMNFKEWWNTPKNYSVAKSACRASWNAGMAEQKEIDAQSGVNQGSGMSVQACIYLTFDDLPDMQLTPEQAKELRDALIDVTGLPEWVAKLIEAKVKR